MLTTNDLNRVEEIVNRVVNKVVDRKISGLENKVVKKLKSKSVLMQGPRSLTYHLESNYRGCLFEITPDTTNSKIESMINKLKRENLLME